MSANAARVQEKHREFDFCTKDFNFIKKLVQEKTGIALSDAKQDMVYGRLSRRLRTLKLKSFSDYCEILRDDDSLELGDFINAITTNLTSFFRENHHFEYLAKTVLPKVMRSNAQSKRIRIWSAGCSTGEEPYSIAMVVRDTVPERSGWDVKILATDLDSNVVAKASAGVYTRERVTGISKQRVSKFFKEKGANEMVVSPTLRDLITFKQLNLMHEWPMKGPFDVIFCRNVVIYFDKPTQRILFDRYANYIVHNGHLFVGHSESLFKVCDRFELIGNTIYQRRA